MVAGEKWSLYAKAAFGIRPAFGGEREASSPGLRQPTFIGCSPNIWGLDGGDPRQHATALKGLAHRHSP